MRLDNFLVLNKNIESRNKANILIKEGNVLVNNKKILKPSFDVDDSDEIEIIKELSYVSRGGLKLEGAIKVFNLDFRDKVILDIGSSTGGFTDCALKHGAKLVYAVDVGKNQLHPTLKNDKRVISYEETNIRDITSFSLKLDYVVMDVSFVSIEYLLPSISRFMNEAYASIILIKPQFEVGKMHLKNGIVKDKNLYKKILENIINELSKYDLGIMDLKLSPIKGGSGNTEFLSLIKKGESRVNILSFLGEINDKKDNS